MKFDIKLASFTTFQAHIKIFHRFESLKKLPSMMHLGDISTSRFYNSRAAAFTLDSQEREKVLTPNTGPF